MARTAKSKRRVPPGGAGQSNSSVDAVSCGATVVDRIIEIARKRRLILSDMRTAIKAGDKDTVFNLATRLTGLSDEASHRTDQSLN
jgi:hypothetical protein